MKIKPADESLRIKTKHASNNTLACPGVHTKHTNLGSCAYEQRRTVMRRTMKNFAKVIEKKERAAWRDLHYIEEHSGAENVATQRALSEWATLHDVKLMFENQYVFDRVYETWMND